MNLHDLVSQLLIDMKGSPDASFFSFRPDSSLGAFLPEIVICATIVLILLVQLPSWGRRVNSNWIALVGSLVALYVAAPLQLLTDAGSIERMEIFTGMLVYDGFSVLMRCLLLGFLALFIVFISLTGIPRRDEGTDINILLLGATLGFCLMVSSNHLLMVFMSIEMASVPSYVLAGMLRKEKLGSEAALKYSVYGAGAAGIMLYGISLLSGLVNAVHLPTVAFNLAERAPLMDSPEAMVLGLALLMIAAGLAFKLSAVPFHFWCPDVFEGAPAEVGGFLSVASKAAALALLVRVVGGIGWVAPEGTTPGSATVSGTQVAVVPESQTGLFSVVDSRGDKTIELTAAVSDASQESSRAAANVRLDRVRSFMAQLIALLAAVTCTFGNLAAYGQNNLKRLLAYSTIAHAGYMMMAVPAVLELVGHSSADARNATAALVIYIFVYLFLNLGAFAVVALLRNRMGSEQIGDYAGLLRSSPGIAICFSLILFGLIGVPPLSGFLGKFAVFAALTDAFRASGDVYLMALLVIGGVNTAVSLFYYLRVVRVMTMTSEAAAYSLPIASPYGLFILLLTAPTALLILGWDRLGAVTIAAAQSLFG